MPNSHFSDPFLDEVGIHLRVHLDDFAVNAQLLRVTVTQRNGAIAEVAQVVRAGEFDLVVKPTMGSPPFDPQLELFAAAEATVQWISSMSLAKGSSAPADATP